MTGQTIRLVGERQRALAHQLIERAPPNAIVSIKPENRSTEQNSRFWALLSDVSRSKPQGRSMTPERWKAVFMQSFGHQVQFETDLEGRPFPIGHSSSRLPKKVMADLMTFIEAWGSENNVVWSDLPNPA